MKDNQLEFVNGNQIEFEWHQIEFVNGNQIEFERHQWFIFSPPPQAFGFSASAPCFQCHRQIQNLWDRKVRKFKMYIFLFCFIKWWILVKNVFHQNFHLFRIQWVPFVPTSRLQFVFKDIRDELIKCAIWTLLLKFPLEQTFVNSHCAGKEFRCSTFYFGNNSNFWSIKEVFDKGSFSYDYLLACA